MTKKKYGLMVSKQIDDVTYVAFFTGNIPHNILQWNRHFELLYFCFENRIMQNINPADQNGGHNGNTARNTSGKT